jgi:RNA-binding protein
MGARVTRRGAPDKPDRTITPPARPPRVDGRPNPGYMRVPSRTEGSPVPLTGKQRRHLRALGHHLEPVVQLGKNGLTDAIAAAVNDAIEHHELVKVRIGTECPDDRHEVAEALAKALGAEAAQVLGRTILLYRRHPKEPKITLPKG